ncbi:MAG: bifunctional diaminohydroxyphosphoribosylaminopyrimidine deaminase/5-amino-6-(5-phosphoribosylamino)uracil reductase RibD [Planctomycetota bacterium]
METAGKNKPFMELALNLACRGFSSVEPNPMVGCVIVRQGKIIGKSWHKKFGQAHAEINALKDACSSGSDPAGATMYVTLEPCCHVGRTGPCTEAIIKAGIAEVYIAMIDPNAHASGKGVEQLRNAGIEVKVGLCGKQAKLLNAGFIKYVRTARPWVIVKWAQSIDARLACSQQRWISCQASRKDTHKFRRSVQGIMVGIGTVLADDPLLTPRPDKGRRPARIVLDSTMKIPLDCQLLKTTDQGDVIVITTQKHADENPTGSEQITRTGAKVISVPQDESGRCDIKSVLDHLGRIGIQRLLVEAGPELISNILKQNLADEVVVYISPQILGAAGTADLGRALSQIQGIDLACNVTTVNFGRDVRIRALTREPENTSSYQ